MAVALYQAETLKQLNEGQYGSRPQWNAIDPVMIEEFQFAISWLSRRTFLQTNYNDDSNGLVQPLLFCPQECVKSAGNSAPSTPKCYNVVRPTPTGNRRSIGAFSKCSFSCDVLETFQSRRPSPVRYKIRTTTPGSVQSSHRHDSVIGISPAISHPAIRL